MPGGLKMAILDYKMSALKYGEIVLNVNNAMVTISWVLV